MSLAIRAHFPLGTFLGHGPDRQPVMLPDMLRLHAALVHAAGTGSTAVPDDRGDLTPSPDAIAALEWFEAHPPSAVQVPDHQKVAVAGARSWRAEGVLENKSSPADRKNLKGQSDATAVNGPIGWAWDEEAPDKVVRVLAQLCEDVSCIGEADSPVVLEVAQIQPTHLGGQARTELTARAPGEIRLSAPTPGRFAELEEAYRAARPKKPPTATRDRFGWNQQPGSAAPPRQAVIDRAYWPIEEPARAPWVAAIRLDLSAPIPSADRVRWAVAVHRSLVSILGSGATPLVTGAYPAGTRHPANRLAIQYVEKHSGQGSFLLLLPAHAALQETRDIHEAARRLRRIHRTRTESRGVLRAEAIDAERYWPPVPKRHRRLWVPDTALIPDTRQARHTPLELLALVAVGYAFRDHFGEFTGRDRFRQVADAVRAAGVRVGDVRRIPDARVERYVHKAPKGVVVQPYTATFDLAALVDDRAVFALGQSRHLGGGLMRPLDVEEDTQ